MFKCEEIKYLMEKFYFYMFGVIMLFLDFFAYLT
jgi:hypothetical protein